MDKICNDLLPSTSSDEKVEFEKENENKVMSSLNP